jgi:hypothetical protein
VSNDPTDCTAGTAPQAEFRTASGTWPRAGGLLLIAIGVAGMLATLGFVALRLFGAALGVLLYLLLAPLAVLAPAFGQSGRATFRRWLTRLIGAALAKLVYSVLLGALLLIVSLLAGITSFGWWTQWLLISVFWWFAFEHRNRMLAFAIHERGERTSRLPLATRVRYGAQAAGSARRVGRAAMRASAAGVSGVADALQQVRGFPTEPPIGSRRSVYVGGGYTARGSLAIQVERSLAADREARAAASDGPAPGRDIAGLRSRRDLLQREEDRARLAGDRRRTVSLALRGQRIDAQIAAQSGDLVGTRASRAGRWVAARRAARGQASRLNREALSGDGRTVRSGRDYGALAGLAGLTASGFTRASDVERRLARLEIERQLAQRRTWLREAGIGPRLPAGLPDRLAATRSTSEEANLPARRRRQFVSRLR